MMSRKLLTVWPMLSGFSNTTELVRTLSDVRMTGKSKMATCIFWPVYYELRYMAFPIPLQIEGSRVIPLLWCKHAEINVLSFLQQATGCFIFDSTFIITSDRVVTNQGVLRYPQNMVIVFGISLPMNALWHLYYGNWPPSVISHLSTRLVVSVVVKSHCPTPRLWA